MVKNFECVIIFVFIAFKSGKCVNSCGQMADVRVWQFILKCVKNGNELFLLSVTLIFSYSGLLQKLTLDVIQVNADRDSTIF